MMCGLRQVWLAVIHGRRFAASVGLHGRRFAASVGLHGRRFAASVGLHGRRFAACVVVAAWLAGCGAHAAQTKPNDALSVQPEITPPAATEATSPPPLAQGSRRRPSLREAVVVRELVASAERVRSLRFAHPVPVLVEDRTRITEYVGTQIEEEELERARIVYTALGLLPADLDVRALLLRLMGEQVVGYYDADEKHLVVRDDIMRGFAGNREGDEQPDLTEARIVLVHELVHALQDQNLQLSAHIHTERDTDASNAFHALVEGDATLAMIGYALEREQIPLHRLTGNPSQVRSFSDVVRHSPLAGSELEQAPAIVRVPLLSSYVDGLSFCASLHGSGGFAAVDRAHTAPPVSTEQILHPERFAPEDAPTIVKLPDLTELTDAGYELVREDTLGELEMSVYFSQGVSDDDAKRAADGWDGDRIRVYRAEGAPAAVVWLSVWDSEKEAEQAAAAADRVVRNGPKDWQASCAVVQKGSSVLMLRDIPKAARGKLPQRVFGH